MSPEKVFKAGIIREVGWLYYFDNGAIRRTRMVRGIDPKRKPSEKPEVVLNTPVIREEGYIYYLDKQGDVSRSSIRVRKPRKKRITDTASIKKKIRNKADEITQGAFDVSNEIYNIDGLLDVEGTTSARLEALYQTLCAMKAASNAYIKAKANLVNVMNKIEPAVL